MYQRIEYEGFGCLTACKVMQVRAAHTIQAKGINAFTNRPWSPNEPRPELDLTQLEKLSTYCIRSTPDATVSPTRRAVPAV